MRSRPTQTPLNTIAPIAPGERQVPHDDLPNPLRPFLSKLYEIPYPTASTGFYRIPISEGVTPILNVAVAAGDGDTV